MGFTTREVSSGPLSSSYPAYYTETQYHNWCPVDVVITHSTGRQVILPKWPKAMDRAPHVAITTRSCNGPRSQVTRTGVTNLDIPGKEFVVDFNSFSSYPIRVDELGVIISTTEMSLIAKDMVRESGYCYNVNETYADFSTVDPRFVFEVKDPFNRWEYLYVNVLGQTITLRCGHKSQLIPDLDGDTLAQYNAECSLSCYLRYPTNYVQAEREIVPVFTINLSEMGEGKAYRLPTGDVICVASSLDGLQNVLTDKHVGSASPNFAALGMVSKDVHEQLIKQLTAKIEQERETAANQLRSMRAKSEATIAENKAKMDEAARENESLKKQVEYYSSIHKSIMDQADRQEKYLVQRDKAREEALANDQKSLDRTFTMLKVGGTLAAGVLSFAVTMMAKSKK